MPGAPSNKSMIQPTIPIDQSIYETNLTQQAPLGTRLELGDRVFYYAQISASVAAGTVLCAPSAVASHQSGILALAAGSIDAKVVSATSSANVAANLYAEGYVGASLGAAKGQLYRIISHNSGSAGIQVQLYDRLAVAITSGTNFFLVKNPYSLVKVGSQGLDTPVGIAPCDHTAAGYGWLQTWGPAAPTHVAATPAAAVCHLGTTGSVTTTFDATTNGGIAAVAFQIGKNQGLAATAGEANPVYITIRP